jgi:hypothetical protein
MIGSLIRWSVAAGLPPPKPRRLALRLAVVLMQARYALTGTTGAERRRR